MTIQKILLLSKDSSFQTRLEKIGIQKDWQITSLTTATQSVTTLFSATFDCVIWDTAACNLDTTLATLMLIRHDFFKPILVLSDTKEARVQRKLYRTRIDGIFSRQIAMDVFCAYLEQKWWLYQQIVKHRQLNQPKKEKPQQLITIGPIQVDRTHFEVSKNKKLVSLTKKEFQLLNYLISHQGQVLSREQLLNGVWGYELLGSSRIVDIHISHLRDKLEVDPKKPKLIKTVRGFGYRLVTEANSL